MMFELSARALPRFDGPGLPSRAFVLPARDAFCKRVRRTDQLICNGPKRPDGSIDRHFGDAAVQM